MALYQADAPMNRLPAATPHTKGTVVTEVFEYTLPVGLAIADKVELGVLPAHAFIVGYTLDNDDCDSGASVTVNIGLMSGEAGKADDTRTVGSELFSASAALQSAAITEGNRQAAFRIAPSAVDRSIGLQLAAGSVTTAGKVRLLVSYRQ